MKNVIIAFIMCLFAFPAFAGIDTTGLSKEQQAEIQLQIEKLKTSPERAVEKYSEYAELGEKIGIAITNVAGELGKSADQFLETTSGKFVVAVILYKVVGSDIISILLGLLWFLFAIPLWFYLLNRFTGKTVRGYKEIYGDNGKVTERIYPEWRNLWESTREYIGWMYALSIVILLLICVAGFTIIA